MSDEITADDVGAPVVDGEGNQVGVVAEVAEDRVTVDPDADVTDDARATLGWNRGGGGPQPLPRRALAREPADEGASDEAVVRVDLDALNRGL